MQRCSQCGMPSISGLKSGQGLCQSHYILALWGKAWLTETRDKIQTKVVEAGTEKEYIFVGIFPDEAVRNVYAQARGDYNTADYHKYNRLVTRLKDRKGVRFICGDFWAKELK
jgi:hypothetical protein